MEWYIESCPHFRPKSGRPPLKRARRPSLSPPSSNPSVGSLDREDDYDDQPRDQYQEKWDELADLRTSTESNTRRINEMDEILRSFGAYQVTVELN